METIDVAVIGGGLIGLAAGAAVARLGLSTCVIEQHARPGLETSTHNSGVIHAGIYHPTASLKTRLCIEGRRLLYEFCATHDVPHRRCGKIIVAHDRGELPALEALCALGQANGVEGLALVTADFVAGREPHVHAVAAIFSSESGVVSAEHLVGALLGSGEQSGLIFLPGTRMLGADAHQDGVVIRTEHEAILARQVVNAAGLYADDVSRMVAGESFTIFPCRGEYVELAPAKRHLVKALVYPLPHPAGHGLGVHLVCGTSGDVWVGPTVRYQDRKKDYENDRLAVDAFLEPARRILPSLTPADLRLSGSGIRAKLHSAAESFADFLIRRDRENPAVIHAAGIDSPGLTSCLAIGEMVAGIVADGS